MKTKNINDWTFLSLALAFALGGQHLFLLSMAPFSNQSLIDFEQSLGFQFFSGLGQLGILCLQGLLLIVAVLRNPKKIWASLFSILALA